MTTKDLAIVDDTASRFCWYVEKVIEVSQLNPREINYQLEIIKPLLEWVLPGYQIPDTSGNSEPRKGTARRHDRSGYALKAGAAPDLLITKDFEYRNVPAKKAAKIYAAVEVKEQASREMLGRELTENGSAHSYVLHLIWELATYLCVTRRVILTNCRRWQFFDREKNPDMDVLRLKQYLSAWNLTDGIDSAGTGEIVRQLVAGCEVATIDVLPNRGSLKKEEYETSGEPDEWIRDLLEIPALVRTDSPESWDRLISYIREFIL